MATRYPPEFRTVTFEFEAEDTDSTPDLWIEETFINQWDDERAVLGGDTYDAKDVIKFDWETTHHEFNGDRKKWIVDADALAELGQKLEEAGYEVAFEPPKEEEDGEALTDLLGTAEVEDSVEVVYEQKNGEGENEKAGNVVDVWEDEGVLRFVREDAQAMYVKADEFGEVGLFTAGSHAPFVGNVVEVTIEK